MDLSQYCQVFGSGVIRVELDWQLLLEHERSSPVTIAENVIVCYRELAALHTVWYVNRGGEPVSYHDPNAVGLRVEEAATLVGHFKVGQMAIERRKRVNELRQRFTAESGPLVFALPAYRLGTDEALLLDGSHRVVAAFIEKPAIRVILFTVEGPHDPLILPDLHRRVLRADQALGS